MKYTLIQYTLAWFVHLFTASGILFGFLAIIAISQADFRMAMIWLVVSLIIDGVDGTLARAFKVKEVLPNFDGNSIDHVIDFATYAIIPAYFFYETSVLPEAPMLRWLGIGAILFSSTYYYGKTSYVTDDLHFEGFPVMWNFVIFYLFFVTAFSPMVNLIIVLILAILHFVPWKYPYPSRTKEFRIWNVLASLTAFVVGLILLIQYPEKNSIWVGLSHLTVAYFMGMTIYKTFFFNKKTK